MEFYRQDYWSGLSFPSSGDLSDPRVEPGCPAVAGRFFTVWATREADFRYCSNIKSCFNHINVYFIFVTLNNHSKNFFFNSFGVTPFFKRKKNFFYIIEIARPFFFLFPRFLLIFLIALISIWDKKHVAIRVVQPNLSAGTKEECWKLEREVVLPFLIRHSGLFRPK